jgi:hypothetical protein
MNMSPSIHNVNPNKLLADARAYFTAADDSYLAFPQVVSHGSTFNNNSLSSEVGYADFTQVLAEKVSRIVKVRGERLPETPQLPRKPCVAAVVLGRSCLINLHSLRGPVDALAALHPILPRWPDDG